MGQTDDTAENQNSEAEFINLPNEIYETALNELIQNNCNLSSDQFDVICEAGSAIGDNYIGVVYRVSVKNKQSNLDELKLIVKCPPLNLARREQFFVRPCFVREIDFYENLFPIYKKFQEDKGIDTNKDGFHQVPFCYKTLLDEPFEGLFFEDLQVRGFEMFDRLKDLSKEHVILVMKTLAKFHAIGFSIKDQKPQLIQPYQELVDIFLQRQGDEGMHSWFENIKAQTTDVIADSTNQDMIDRVDDLLKNNFFELIEACISPELTEPYAVVCHGDSWNNNIMYKNDKNGKPVDICLLDFQILRYASPITDLMYFIFACTQQSLRDQHYQEFLDVYYAALSEFITRLGSSPEKVYPRGIFEDHLKRFGKFGFVLSMVVLPLFTSDAQNIPNMDEVAEKIKESKDAGEQFDTKTIVDFTKLNSVNTYNDRMKGVIEDMYKLGYL